jgi:hypothetical protein
MTAATDPRTFERAFKHQQTRTGPTEFFHQVTGEPLDVIGEVRATGCEVVDAIVHADEVEPGDLMLAHGVLAVVDGVDEDASQTAYVCLTIRHAALNGAGLLKLWRQRHLLVAVRRYQNTEA